jgi:SAM-dependent methyltransferase
MGNGSMREVTAIAPPHVASIATLMREPAGEVIDEISPRDAMFNGHPDLGIYNVLADAALGSIRLALLIAQKQTVNGMLDLPSGHGRVTRMLRAEFPDAKLACCDIDHDAVDFCGATFDAIPIYGREAPALDMFAGLQFDLIWCGSLLTHLDSPMWKTFLDLFEAVLVPDGILVFTTHGRPMAGRLRDPELGPMHIPDAQVREAILSDYDEQAFGYADYELPDGHRDALSLPKRYGTSLARPSWVCRQVEDRPGLRLLTYMEGRWGGSQDVIACLRL